MSNQDTKITTEQHIDTHQKPIASFGQGEKAFLIQKDSADPSCILTFPQLLQAKSDAKDGQVGSQQNPVPLVVDTPVGKGIVLERRHGRNQSEREGRPVNHIVLGEAEKAIQVYITKDGIVHWTERPKQVVVDAPQCLVVHRGQLKEGSELLLYGLLEEGKGKEAQQFVLNRDGSLSAMHAPDLVWGWEPPVIRKARMDEISAFVIKHANWPAELVPSSCKANELKGGGSPLTEVIYTVESPNARVNPSKVVLKRYVDNPLRNRRLVAASNAFSKVGGAPAIIASADNWIIEPYAGHKPEFSSETWMRRMGELAARLHTASTDWFNFWQEEMHRKYPCLQNVPVGSLIWSCVAYHEGNLEKYTAEEMLQLSTSLPEPLSESGGEMVSTHGDLHKGNTLLTPSDVLLAVDFEHSCVSQIRQDLLYNAWESGPNRRTLCTVYLKTRGLPCSKREVDLLAVDIIVAAVVYFRVLRGILFPKEAGGDRMDMKQGLSELNKLTPVVQGLADDIEGCARVVDKTNVRECMGNIDQLIDLCTNH